MGWSTIFTQILTYFGFYSSGVPPFQTGLIPAPNGPMFPITNGPIIPIIDSFTENTGEEYIEELVKLSEEKCGLSMNDSRMLSTKIIGGRDAKISDFPWQVSLQRRSGFGLSHFCGASLIHPKWVITAAHCLEWTLFGSNVRRDAITRIRVIAGTQTISPSIYSKSYEVSNVILNPLYDTRSGFNDIALIALKTPIKFLAQNNLPINTICLPNGENQPIANKVTTTGWGTTQENGRNSYNLKSVDLPLVSSKQCQRMYGRRGFSIDSMLCAGSEGKDSCQGDSGGGLIQRDSTGKATIVGIVSVGNGCGRKGYPGIYTKVTHYIDWIHRLIDSQ